MISALMMINFPDPFNHIRQENDEKLILDNLTEVPVPVTGSDLLNVLNLVEIHEKTTFNCVELVYVDADEILRINRKYLDHDYITDIITFRNDENDGLKQIEGTLFCCAPRIQEQAEEFGEQPRDEFNRVFIHGLLHLAEYDDQSEIEKAKMREREDFYLGLIRPDVR